MKDVRDIKKGEDKNPYAKPQVRTLSTEQIIEDLGPASALYGAPGPGGP